MDALMFLRRCMQKPEAVRTGEGVAQALSRLMGGNDEPLSSSQIALLQKGLDHMVYENREDTLRKVRIKEQAQLQELESCLSVELSGAVLPLSICTVILQELAGHSRSVTGAFRLAQVSRNWRAVANSPHSWRVLKFEHYTRFKKETLVKMLSQPSYKGVKFMRLPTMKMSNDLAKSVAKHCPNITGLDIKHVGGPFAASSMQTLIKSFQPLNLRMLILPYGVLEFQTLVASFQTLRVLDMRWWAYESYPSKSHLSAALVAQLFTSIGNLRSLEHLSLVQGDYTKDYDATQDPITDSEMAKVACGCLKLKHLQLGNMLSLRRVWAEFATHSKQLQSVTFDVGYDMCRKSFSSDQNGLPWLVETTELLSMPQLKSVEFATRYFKSSCGDKDELLTTILGADSTSAIHTWAKDANHNLHVSWDGQRTAEDRQAERPHNLTSRHLRQMLQAV